MNDYVNVGLLSPRPTKSPKNLWVYLGFLAGSKLSRVFGLYLSYDILKVIHIVQFLCIIKLCSAVPFLFLQKPFTSGRKISKNQWFRIIRHAFFGSFIQILWLFGLTLCGPLRTTLLYEHSDLVLVAAAGALCSVQGSSPAKLRGAVFLIAGLVSLLLFDHDDLSIVTEYEPDAHKHSSVLTHAFYHIVGSLGWSDHKGGVMLLFGTLLLSCGFNSASKKLSVDMGGAKRLHALSTLVSFIILTPWALFITFTKESDLESWTSLFVPLVIIILSVFIVDFYVDAIASNHLQPHTVTRYAALFTYVGALTLALCWNHPLISSITTMTKLREIIREDHVLSSGVLFSLICFIIAMYVLSSPGRASRGSFIGYSPGGMPLYSYTSDALQRTSQSASIFFKNGLKRILEESNSRRIFYFLLINLGFTFVELIYGVLTNSLGLISDGFHMLFDCSALVMGLFAAIMTRWKPTRTYSFGYDRVEVLSGFVNGLFLVVIAFFVFGAALSRLVHPQEVKTEKLLTVSVLGLCVNLIGIFAFHGAHGHAHGMTQGHGHSHAPAKSHGHSHGAGHSHQDRKQCSSHNTNMEGVFLHILADTLGSVGVIISSILIEHFGWTMADPLCSIFISILIFISVIPLLKETAMFLLLGTPTGMGQQLRSAITKVLNLDGVIGYRDPHFWHHTSTRILGTVHIQAAPDVAEQKLIAQVASIFKDEGLDNIVVQLEKEMYFQHLHGLSHRFSQSSQYAHNRGLLTAESTAIVKSV